MRYYADTKHRLQLNAKVTRERQKSPACNEITHRRERETRINPRTRNGNCRQLLSGEPNPETSVNATLTRLSRLTADKHTTDGPLLDAFLTGDQNAFAVLVRRHAGLVFATCRRILRHQQDAEDAFQATFLVLARRASDVWPREAVGSWLFGVAYRVALKARATRNRRVTRELPLQDIAGEETRPDFDLAESVHRVICKLPEVYRAAVVACDLEGLSRKEAAARLGWSEGTLSGRLARARELMAKRFRRLGLTLPAGGLMAFATTETASATTIQSTIDLATGTAGGAPAAVVALTEGVVQSMAFFKVKAMTAAVLTACVIGFGVLAASGAGSGTGEVPGTKQAQSASTPLAPVSAQPVEPPAKPASPPAKPVTDRDLFQGNWRIVSVMESGKTTPTNPKDPWVIEVSGSTLRMPYLESGTMSWKQREYTFTVDETKTPREIDLIAKNRPVGRGIYEFVAPAAACASCHKQSFLEGGSEPHLAELFAPCAPAAKNPQFMRSGWLRLALSLDEKRPAKFDGAGVIVFELKRPDPQDDERERLLRQQKELTSALEAAVDAKQKAEFEAQLRFKNAMLDLHLAQSVLSKAEAQLKASHAQLAQAEAQVAVAEKDLQMAKERVKVAEKAAEDVKKLKPSPQKSNAVFTIHIRTLTAAEKVIRVKATGKETVLEGLVHAADDVSIKSDTLSVWVVREKAILSVDLPAILKGDSKTNYALKPGDQLFVQVKPGK
jgi:RNA polymerase sigma factor (sigma-70 family)